MEDIAIAHDQFRTMGGAEIVACEIAREFDAPIYVMRVDEGVAPDDVEIINLADQKGEWLMNRHYMIQDAYQMVSWSHVKELYEFDTVIQTKTNPYWFVPKDRQTVVRYCHSTPRNLYDQFHRSGGHFLKDGLRAVQRMLYQQVIPYGDAWVANSELVQQRMKKYFGLNGEDNVQTIHPPVDVESCSPDVAETQDFLLYLGRIRHHKRVGLLCDVAESLDTKVVIAGDGPHREEIAADAPDNVEWLGYVTEDEKARLLSEAAATVFLAENEDFGIVPIESLASGTPVIGVNEGFTKLQVEHGTTGMLCDPTIRATYESIQEFQQDGVAWSEDEIAEWTSLHFGRDKFRRELRAVVEDAQERTTVKPSWEMERPTTSRIEVRHGN